MSDEVKIETIDVTVGDKKLTLTMEQARKLHAELAGLFADKPVQYYPVYPYTWPMISYQCEVSGDNAIAGNLNSLAGVN